MKERVSLVLIFSVGMFVTWVLGYRRGQEKWKAAAVGHLSDTVGSYKVRNGQIVSVTINTAFGTRTETYDGVVTFSGPDGR